MTKALGIDEISVKKGHKYFKAITYDIEAGKVIEILEDRDKETVKKHLSSLGKGVFECIKVVSMDVWEGFRRAVQEVFEGKVDIAGVP